MRYNGCMAMTFCPLYSGSSGNAAYLEAGGARILIDAGLPGRMIEDALKSIGADPKSLNAILVTHEHSDHVRGVGVLARRYGLPVYLNGGCLKSLPAQVGRIPPENLRVFETGRPFFLGDTEITPFSTYHDCAEPVGFSFTDGSCRVSMLTDVGHVDERLMKAVANSDLLLLESNHDVDLLKSGPYPYPLKMRILSDVGHLSNAAAGRALAALSGMGVKNALLGHLSRENNYEQLALDTVKGVLAREGVTDVTLHLALRTGPAGVYDIA